MEGAGEAGVGRREGRGAGGERRTLRKGLHARRHLEASTPRRAPRARTLVTLRPRTAPRVSARHHFTGRVFRRAKVSRVQPLQKSQIESPARMLHRAVLTQDAYLYARVVCYIRKFKPVFARANFFGFGLAGYFARDPPAAVPTRPARATERGRILHVDRDGVEVGPPPRSRGSRGNLRRPRRRRRRRVPVWSCERAQVRDCPRRRRTPPRARGAARARRSRASFPRFPRERSATICAFSAADPPRDPAIARADPGMSLFRPSANRIVAPGLETAALASLPIAPDLLPHPGVHRDSRLLSLPLLFRPSSRLLTPVARHLPRVRRAPHARLRGGCGSPAPPDRPLPLPLPNHDPRHRLVEEEGGRVRRRR